MFDMSHHDPALLLIGPTGAGKTPLGEELARRGILGRRAVHFDFGANLRRAVREPTALFAPEELQVLRNVLASGALLEKGQEPIAGKILARFRHETALRCGEWLILNGFPRHVGQAEYLSGFITIRAVVELVCPPEVVLARIFGNIAGDRTGRDDDTLPKIIDRMNIYHERTQPLVEFYRQKGIPIFQISVGKDTVAAELADQVEGAIQHFLAGGNYLVPHAEPT